MQAQNYPTEDDAYREGKALMNRKGRELGHLAPGGPEDVRFRSFFGMGVGVVIASWHLMAEHDLLPPGPIVSPLSLDTHIHVPLPKERSRTLHP